jgi:hypothetical protein
MLSIDASIAAVALRLDAGHDAWLVVAICQTSEMGLRSGKREP